MPRLDMELTTDVAPDVLRASLIDFGPDRRQLWPGMEPSLYEVRARGDTWAIRMRGYASPTAA